MRHLKNALCFSYTLIFQTRLLRIFLLPLLFKRCMESEDVVEERQQRRLTLQQLKATQEKSLNTGSTTFKMYDASLKKTTQLFMPVYLGWFLNGDLGIRGFKKIKK